MPKKIVTIYESKWRKRGLASFIGYLRDILTQVSPNCLINKTADFIFLVHPRRYEDIFIALPFLSFLAVFPSRVRNNILAALPPFILDEITDHEGFKGLIVSTITVPEWLIKNRQKAFRKSLQCIRFSSKILKGKHIGLGGLWPMVTRQGLALQTIAAKYGKIITNGHCGTALSIYLMIERISSLANMKLNEIRVAIIGAGRMGANLSNLILNKVKEISLIDKNQARLKHLKNQLMTRAQVTELKFHNSNSSNIEMQDILARHHLAVCATSNVKSILRPMQIPRDYIIIDDSRPEAIPRLLDSKDKIILEGGLMKIKGVKLSYDYGFGIDEDVFGCLAETYLLAKSAESILKPTIGKVDGVNFDNMFHVAQKLNVSVGNFKTGTRIIDDETIAMLFKRRQSRESSLARPA